MLSKEPDREYNNASQRQALNKFKNVFHDITLILFHKSYYWPYFPDCHK